MSAAPDFPHRWHVETDRRVVMFTDHERVVAELEARIKAQDEVIEAVQGESNDNFEELEKAEARIKELEAERLKDAQFVESARDLRWRQAIEGLGAIRNPNWTDEENRAYGLGLKAALHAIDPDPEPVAREANNE